MPNKNIQNLFEDFYNQIHVHIQSLIDELGPLQYQQSIDPKKTLLYEQTKAVHDLLKEMNKIIYSAVDDYKPKTKPKNIFHEAPIALERIETLENKLWGIFTQFPADKRRTELLSNIKADVRKQVEALSQAAPEQFKPYQLHTIFQAGYSINQFAQQPRTNKSQNIVSDWQRTLKNDQMTVNGQPLKNYADQYNQFGTQADLSRFFKEVLLKDVTEGNKEEMANTLITTFHQDGLLWPVTSSFSHALSALNTQNKQGIYPDTPTGATQQIHLISTPNGLKIQEYMSANGLKIVSEDSPFRNLVTEVGETIYATGKDRPIVKAEGVIDVRFSPKNSKPSLQIESNHINYGHPSLEKSMNATRTWEQFFTDLVHWIESVIFSKPSQTTKTLSEQYKTEINHMKPNKTDNKTDNKNNDDPTTTSGPGNTG